MSTRVAGNKYHYRTSRQDNNIRFQGHQIINFFEISHWISTERTCWPCQCAVDYRPRKDSVNSVEVAAEVTEL